MEAERGEIGHKTINLHLKLFMVILRIQLGGSALSSIFKQNFCFNLDF